MGANIVRQPIIGPDGEAYAYELLYEDRGVTLYNQQDTQAANMIEDFLLEMDNVRLLNNKKAFITFTPNLLEKDIPKMFNPEHLVIQIEDTILVHPVAQKLIEEHKKSGYEIAIKGFEFSSRYFAILDIVDIIKINMSKPNPSLNSILDIARSFGKRVIGYGINSKEIYDTAKSYGIEYLQGTHVAESMYSPVAQVEHLQSNFFQLIIAITKDEPDLDEIATIISRDVTLTFSLLKLVNSAYFALRNPARSVKQALVVLGVGQLKQWVYLLSFKNSDGKIPTELIKTSFLRGQFCQELAPYIPDLPISKSEAYLMGMFSTLGLLMGVKLEDALEPLPITDDIKDGLLKGEGICGTLFQLVLKYDNADWKGMTPLASELGIEENIVSQKYLESAEYVNQVWNDLMSPYSAESTKK
ncbi:HDOD domain-containing protein [Ruminococcaceae bacterium OttesenSCG-928-D13]|nr:HDOD domain-containing protein [Ruminococcaceae bacterium OttesenSCG-928-D13]